LAWGRKRWLKTYPDDTWIVSYPKSGNTWLRFLIGNLLSPQHPVTFENLEARIHDIYKHDNTTLANFPRPRVLKSHEPYDRRYARVVYVVRDPRAVLVSLHHHLRRIGSIADEVPIANTVDRFLRGGRWGRWSDHVAAWLDCKSHGQHVFWTRYEHLSKDPLGEAQRICAFLGLEHDTATVAKCVELSAATRMRDLESTQSELWVETAGRRKDIPFIRSASPEIWREELSPQIAERVFVEFSELMSRLGYAP
jgi:hypothetical protein